MRPAGTWVVELGRTGSGGGEPDQEVHEGRAPGALRLVDRGLALEDRCDDVVGVRDALDAEPAVVLRGEPEGLFHEVVDLRRDGIIHAASGERRRLLHEPPDEPEILVLGLDRRRREARSIVEASLDLGQERELAADLEELPPRREALGHPGRAGLVGRRLDVRAFRLLVDLDAGGAGEEVAKAREQGADGDHAETGGQGEDDRGRSLGLQEAVDLVDDAAVGRRRAGEETSEEKAGGNEEGRRDEDETDS